VELYLLHFLNKPSSRDDELKRRDTFAFTFAFTTYSTIIQNTVLYLQFWNFLQFSQPGKDYVNMPSPYKWDGWGSKLGFLKFFSSSPRPVQLWGPPSLPIQWVLGVLSLGYSSRGAKLTTHLHLVPMSRMHGAIPPLPQRVFMARW